MRNPFRPTRTAVVLFALLVLIAIGGFVQAGAFSADERLQQKRPDRLSFLPLWETWVILGAPVHAVLAWLERRNLLRGAVWAVVYVGAQLLYFYLLATVLAFLSGTVARRLRR